MARVYVYGTLKRGGARNQVMDESTYERTVVLRGYAMYDLGSFPGVIPETDGEVVAEQWDSPPWIIDALDKIEGVDRGLYRRVTARADDGTYGWIYELANTDFIRDARRIVCWPTFDDVAQLGSRV